MNKKQAFSDIYVFIYLLIKIQPRFFKNCFSVRQNCSALLMPYLFKYFEQTVAFKNNNKQEFEPGQG